MAFNGARPIALKGWVGGGKGGLLGLIRLRTRKEEREGVQKGWLSFLSLKCEWAYLRPSFQSACAVCFTRGRLRSIDQ